MSRSVTYRHVDQFSFMLTLNRCMEYSQNAQLSYFCCYTEKEREEMSIRSLYIVFTVYRHLEKNVEGSIVLLIRLSCKHSK